MVVAEQQLKEEVYAMALKKLQLEEEIKSLMTFMASLKKELDYRTPLKN